MSEEIELKNVNDDLFRVIKSDNDLLEFLREQLDEFKFLSLKFTVDIDLHAILSVNPIPGITLLKRKSRETKPDILRTFSPVFDCTDIQFDKPVHFWNCHFEIPADFKNVVFKKGFSFNLSRFENELSMMMVRAERESIFGFKSGSSVMMMNCIFEVINNQYSEISVKGSFTIENTTINSGLDLNGCKINGQLNLISIKLNGRLDLSQSKITTLNLGSLRNSSIRSELGDLSIAYTEFQGQVQLSNLNINGKVSSQGAVFKENIFFTNLNFNKDVHLNHSILDKPINADNVCANGNFSFYGSTINADMHLNDIDFSNANVSFIGSRINADLWLGALLHNDVKAFTGTMTFQGAMIAATSIVRIFNLNTSKSPAGKIDFSNALIRGLLDIRNVYVNKITFNGTVVPGNIQDNNSLQLAIADGNTARLLKHEARRINNSISAVAYNKIEMKLYAETLSIRKFADWSMLRLNFISNNYGSDWLWGIVFTIACGLICYSMFIISVFGFGLFWEDNWNFIYNDNKFWSGFVNYFWLPTGFNALIKDDIVQGGIRGGFTFITGKIMIAYGIYQTVAAFRKYT